MNPKPNKKLSLGAVLRPFPVILLKLATLRSPPTPNKVEFCAKWVEMSAFYTKILLRGVGDDEMNPKLNKKLSLGAVLGPFQVILLKKVPVRSPPTPNKVKICAMGGNECFFLPQHCWGELGDDGMNLKPNKKWLLGAGFYVTITWKGFFTQP